MEALLFRFVAAFPQSAAPQPGTLEEWLTSDVAGFELGDAFEAFDDWKQTHDWPPTIAQFIDHVKLCRNRRRRIADEQQKLLTMPDDVVPPEEGREWVQRVKDTINEVRRHHPVVEIEGLTSIGGALAKTIEKTEDQQEESTQ